jgi:hypothetical protein
MTIYILNNAAGLKSAATIVLQSQRTRSHSLLGCGGRYFLLVSLTKNMAGGLKEPLLDLLAEQMHVDSPFSGATTIAPALEICIVCGLLVGPSTHGGYTLAGRWNFMH